MAVAVLGLLVCSAGQHKSVKYKRWMGIFLIPCARARALWPGFHASHTRVLDANQYQERNCEAAGRARGRKRERERGAKGV